MIEYLYNAIRATAGQDVIVTAYITDEDERVITEGCHIMLYDKDRKTLLHTVDGVYHNENGYFEWIFTIPGELTKELDGRYWYCICYHDKNLCFREPIYFV